MFFSLLDARLGPYSKLLLASPSQALRMVEEEKAALQAQLGLEDDAQGCFIQSALCLLQVATAPPQRRRLRIGQRGGFWI